MKLFYCYLLIIGTLMPHAAFSNPYPVRAWTNVLYNNHFSSNPDWLYGFSLEGRFDTQPGLFYEGLIQGQLGYTTSSSTQFWVGYTLIPSTVVHPTGRVSGTIQRFYQQLNAALLKNLSFELNSRSRLEERQKHADIGVGFVFRQLFMLNMPKWRLKNKYTPFVSNEYFININKPVWSNQKHFNQNRLMLGFIFPCFEYQCQLGYLNQFFVAKTQHQINSVLYFSFIIASI